MIRGTSIISILFLLLSCNPVDEVIIVLDELTVSDIHDAFRNGDYTAEQLISAYLDRIENIDSVINSLTYINPSALEEARKMDEEFESTGELRPLHGIPLIVKDNINTAGLPTTAGALALKDFIPDQDAFIIRNLKEAGAIILAKSNMAEWAFSPMHSESSTAGTTRNPYNPKHVPAGSSGGTAASVAANLGVLGLGTDTGNSIRGPSSHTSLVGFRMTLGLVSRSAIIPLYLRNDVVGPMCRTVEDATRVLEVIVGQDTEDPLTQFSKGKVPANYQQFLQADGLAGARIGVLRTLSDNDPHPEIASLFEQAISDLELQGAEIIDPLEIPQFDSLRQNQWCAEFKKDVENYLAKYVANDTISTIDDIIRIGTKSEFSRGRLIRQRDNTDRYGDPNPCLDAYSDLLRIAFRSTIENTMDSLRLDAIIYPSWNHPPALVNQFQEGYRGDNSQVIAPHTGQPAFTVPMGFTSEGLPAGLQFLGRTWDEGTLIKLCYSYEQATQHRRSPGL